MKIKQNFILAYLVPLLIALFCVIGGISEKSASVVIFGLIIVVLCLISWNTTTLEIKDGFIMGHSGLIKKRTLSSPLAKIQYCEYTTFLCFNKISINCITGQYDFKNMSKAKPFVELVHNSINN